MSKLFLVLKVILGSFYWSRAVHFYSRRNYGKVLSNLQASARYRLVFDEEFLLLRGFSLFMLGDEASALKDFSAALNYSATQKSSLNEDEVIYINNYVFDVFSFSESNPYKFGGKYVDRNVSSNLKDLFPLSDWLTGFSRLE